MTKRYTPHTIAAISGAVLCVAILCAPAAADEATDLPPAPTTEAPLPLPPGYVDPTTVGLECVEVAPGMWITAGAPVPCGPTLVSIAEASDLPLIDESGLTPAVPSDPTTPPPAPTPAPAPDTVRVPWSRVR